MELPKHKNTVFVQNVYTNEITELSPTNDGGDFISWGCTDVKKSTLRKMYNLGITSFELIREGRKINVSEKDAKTIFKYVQNQYDNGK